MKKGICCLNTVLIQAVLFFFNYCQDIIIGAQQFVKPNFVDCHFVCYDTLPKVFVNWSVCLNVL